MGGLAAPTVGVNDAGWQHGECHDLPASRHLASAVDHNAQSAGVVAADLLATCATLHGKRGVWLVKARCFSV